MKLKFAYAFAALALAFAAFMAYLWYIPQVSTPAAGSVASPKTSAGPARAVIAYAGDLMGSLDPCG
jgi:hypothetical protein